MTKYHKIDSLFKRDMTHPRKPLIIGDWAAPVFDYLQYNNWTFTEKVDGTNIRVIIGNGAVTFDGRTDNAAIPAPLVKRLQEQFLSQSDTLLTAFPDGAVFYGEGYGAKIHNGGLYRPDQAFVLFDVKVGRYWLQRDNVEDIGAKYGIDVVPVITTGTLHDAISYVRHGFNSQWGAFKAEGIVARPSVELQDRGGHRIITKIKHRDF